MDWFFAHAWTAIELFFAGAWTMIWERGLGIGLILFFVALAFGSELLRGIPMFGPFIADILAPLRKDLLWAAFGVALILGGEYVGADAEKKKCVAQTVVIEHVTDKAVAKTKTPRARAAKDRWDNPEN